MIYNVYKPKNWTSFDVVAKVRKVSGEKKVGHAGTLDPLAEGVLIVLTGKDTKRQDEFMHLPKAYYFEAAFGVTTPSCDLEFEPTFQAQPTIAELEPALKVLVDKYTGEFDQTVPLFSAKKVNGQPLYKVARKNAYAVKLAAGMPQNRVTIYEFIVKGFTDIELNTDKGLKKLPLLQAEIKCSSGTYVRSLINDLGEELGCGAVAVKIIRTAVGNFKVTDAKQLTKLIF